jgi:hypothetical protein
MRHMEEDASEGGDLPVLYGMSVEGHAERFVAMTDEKVQRAAMRVSSQSKRRPHHSPQCLIITAVVNGLEARVLLDSGSLINAMSPAFAAVSRTVVFPLENPVGLQLGCVGSRSKINFGTQTRLEIAGRTIDTYLDVVNLDHYDVVLGMPFLEKDNVHIDFAQRVVWVGSTMVPTIQGEGKEYQYPKRTKTVEMSARKTGPVAGVVDKGDGARAK